MTFASVAKHRHVWPIRCRSVGRAKRWASIGRAFTPAKTIHQRPISASAHEDAKLVMESAMSFKTSQRTYGARRVWRDVLKNGLGWGLNRSSQRLLLDNGITCSMSRAPAKSGTTRRWSASFHRRRPSGRRARFTSPAT